MRKRLEGINPDRINECTLDEFLKLYSDGTENKSDNSEESEVDPESNDTITSVVLQ